jgi:hypothetical protein
MSPDIPPVAIEPILLPRSPRAQNLKHTTRNLKPDIRTNNFPARDQSRQLTAPSSSHGPPRSRSWRAAIQDIFKERRTVLPALAVHGSELRPDTIEQGVGGEQVRVPTAVSFQDVELLSRAVFVVAAEGPGARTLGSISGSRVEGALGYSEVEVAED